MLDKWLYLPNMSFSRNKEFIIPPVYVVYSGYIVFVFYVTMFVSLFVCKKNLSNFSQQLLTKDFEICYKHRV